MANSFESKPMTVNLLSGNRLNSPPGISGGKPGACGHNLLRKKNAEIIELDSTCQLDVDVGDKLIIKTPGGGGFGHSIE